MKDKLRGAWRSVTIRFNAFFGLFMCNFDTIRDGLPQIQPYMTPGLFGKLMIGAFIVNIVLRFKTNCDLAAK